MSDTAYERVKLARDSKRPTGLDYIRNIFRGFMEFHGDRRFGDDPAIVGGIARLNGMPVTVIAIEKGHTAKERTCRNFGMPQPEGYRKALRLICTFQKMKNSYVHITVQIPSLLVDCCLLTSGVLCGQLSTKYPRGRLQLQFTPHHLK
jgi:acetyl-CoA carboxylase carboxyl transferase subunit alpha